MAIKLVLVFPQELILANQTAHFFVIFHWDVSKYRSVLTLLDLSFFFLDCKYSKSRETLVVRKSHSWSPINILTPWIILNKAINMF